MDSNGRVAIVTGGGTGIGRHSALALVRGGYSVAIAGRRLEPLQAAIAEAGDDGERMLAVQTDVGRPEEVQALFADTNARFGRLDVLFNNAGFGAPGVLLEELTYEQWQGVVDTNLTGTFLCTQEAFKIMKSQTPEGRTHHQQRLCLGPDAPRRLCPLHGHETRDHRAYQVDLA